MPKPSDRTHPPEVEIAARAVEDVMRKMERAHAALRAGDVRGAVEVMEDGGLHALLAARALRPATTRPLIVFKPVEVR